MHQQSEQMRELYTLKRWQEDHVWALQSLPQESAVCLAVVMVILLGPLHLLEMRMDMIAGVTHEIGEKGMKAATIRPRRKVLQLHRAAMKYLRILCSLQIKL
jgi:hypothetical protein